MNTDKVLPAFPTWDEYHGADVGGVTLRDYFAAKAMQGMLSNFEWMQHARATVPDMPGEEVVPTMAYEIADAMLAERVK